ncbi:MAG: zinc ABC transporter substrate-binding protein [Alphaproteobacteria bacterium CG11_big_fil_rev_8_21_14_0_20_44_7]|nr:MAG: zinc ABC transporter substrate-binding protein [Alphaproteobacteria bacterium CG11_big_fil_rev_8_21_14_0_20_44_7]
MKILSLITIGVGLLIAAPANAELKVFACEPEWKALAEEIGGEKVEAYSATHAMQDPHHIRAKPSLIAKMRNADLLICSGASLEIGWLPILLQKAGNAKMQQGEVGYLMASEYVDILEKPETIDRSMGDVHPEGNPHIHLNPHNILKVANELTDRLISIDEENRDYYIIQKSSFDYKWELAIRRWEKKAANLKGENVITHHKNWVYLSDWLGLNLIETLEEKSGVPPSSSHLEKVLQTARNNEILAILRTPYSPSDASEWLAEKTQIPALVLPFTVGGNEQANDLFSLFDETIRMLKEQK